MSTIAIQYDFGYLLAEFNTIFFFIAYIIMYIESLGQLGSQTTTTTALGFDIQIVINSFFEHMFVFISYVVKQTKRVLCICVHVKSLFTCTIHIAQYIISIFLLNNYHDNISRARFNSFH